MFNFGFHLKSVSCWVTEAAVNDIIASIAAKRFIASARVNWRRRKGERWCAVGRSHRFVIQSKSKDVFHDPDQNQKIEFLLDFGFYRSEDRINLLDVEQT